MYQVQQNVFRPCRCLVGHLVPGSKVLVIDHFMKAGGTAQGMIDLANEVGV